MAMKSKISDKEIDELVKRYNGGEPLYKICKRLPCGQKYAKKLLLERQIHIRGKAEANHRSEKDVKEIILRYENGESCSSIAPDFDLTPSGVNQLLKRENISRRSQSESKGGLPPELHPEICKQYLDGVRTVEIMKKYSISESQVYRILELNGIERSNYKLTDEQCEEAVKLYQDGMSFKAVGERFGVSKTAIMDLFERRNLPKRTTAETLRIDIDNEDLQEWKEQYESGISITKIAAKSEYSAALITDRLREIGVEVRPTNRFIAEDQIKLLIDKYKEGCTSTTELSKEFGICCPTIYNILKERGEDFRRVESFNEEFENKVIDMYAEGKSSVQIEEELAISNSSVGRILRRNGIQMRSISIARGGMTEEQEKIVCDRYSKEEASADLAEEFEIYPSTITRILNRHNVEPRKPGNGGDSIYWCLTDRHLFSNPRSTSFYAFRLKRFPEYIKIGISFNIDIRSSDEEYGEFLFEYEFSTRHEAFIVEQTVLSLLRPKVSCPVELRDEWPGWTEVLLAPETELIETTEWVFDQLEEKGMWQVAMDHIEMIDSELELCKKRLVEK